MGEDKIMRNVIAVAVTAFALTATGTVSADPVKEKKKHTTMCWKAFGVRELVVKKHGKRAPGRNICRYGVQSKFNPKWERPASSKEKSMYLHALLALIAPPPPYMTSSAGPPALPPAGTLSARNGPTGLAGCIVQHESGGNPLATNGRYHGIAQWSPEAWARHGGRKYASDPHGATYQQQLLVLSAGLARFGCRDWCPYDGC